MSSFPPPSLRSGAPGVRIDRLSAARSTRLLAALVVLTTAAVGTSASGLREWSPYRWNPATITGQPISPPPHLIALLPRFHALLHSYVALDGDAKMPFGAWVIANGTADPIVVRGMVELYMWYQPWLRGSA